MNHTCDVQESNPADDGFATERSREIQTLLSTKRWRPWREESRKAPKDPEARAMLARLYWSIGEAQRLKAKMPYFYAEEELARVLSIPLKSPSLELLLEIVDVVDQVILENADGDYLAKELEAEYVRAQEGETYRITLDRIYGNETCRLTTKSRAGEAGELCEVQEARNCLRGLRQARTAQYRLQRARQRLKIRYLWTLAAVLAVLVSAMAFTLTRQRGVETDQVLLAGVAGAFGAALSGALKLRDYIKQVNQLRVFRPGIVVEPLLGCGFGLILFLLLQTDIVELGSLDVSWAKVAVFALLAGFSEPFTLKLLTRVAGMAEGPAKGSVK